MSDTKPTAEPILAEAMVDVRTLARIALESDDIAVIKRDLEMILTIPEWRCCCDGSMLGQQVQHITLNCDEESWDVISASSRATHARLQS